MTDIVCPTCQTDEHLAGEPNGELIRLTCAACNTSWDRDPSPSCGRCGSTEVVAVPKAAWDKARGAQLSISYITVVHLCPDCDTELLRRQRQTNSPLPPDVNPAADGG
jgi:ssDNA-binding Zn-finger/Zn-ribbon topoisomerase 1